MPFEIYVGNFPYEFNRYDVVNLFKDFKGITLQKFFKKNGKSYCFFSCDEIEKVVSVIQKMNKVEVFDRKLVVRASNDKLQKHVELILQDINRDPETLKEEEFHVATKNIKEISHVDMKNIKEKPHVTEKNIKEISHNSSDSPPFVPMQVLRYKSAQKACQISSNDVWETNSLHSKSPSSHSSFSECNYNSFHQRFSNNSFLNQDDEVEYVWLSVTNFPLRTSHRLIYELFDDYAPLKVIMICNYPRKDKALTEAHVCFLNREVADDVIMNFDNTMFNGRLLLVNDVEDLTVMKELVTIVP